MLQPPPPPPPPSPPPHPPKVYCGHESQMTSTKRLGAKSHKEDTPFIYLYIYIYMYTSVHTEDRNFKIIAGLKQSFPHVRLSLISLFCHSPVGILRVIRLQLKFNVCQFPADMFLFTCKSCMRVVLLYTYIYIYITIYMYTYICILLITLHVNKSFVLYIKRFMSKKHCIKLK